MPPFRRGRAQAWQSYRGNGRAGRAARSVSRPVPFTSSRVEDQEVHSEVSDHEVESASENHDNETISSSEGGTDEEVERLAENPYNVLLNSLNARNMSNQRQRKRRRLEEPKSDETSTLVGASQTFIDDEDSAASISMGEDDDDMEDGADDVEEDRNPYHVHFSNHDEVQLASLIQSTKGNQWKVEKLTATKGINILRKRPANAPSSTNILTNDLHLKARLKDASLSLLNANAQLQKELVPPIFHYQDLFFPERSLENAKRLRDLAALHALNHVLKTRSRVLKGNAHAKQANQDEDSEHRDQGFTRPKVLILLPTKQSCVRYLESITSVAKPEQQENRKQFQERFATVDDTFSAEKPEDFRELFGGNDDDMFRMGIKFTRKTMKHFSNFYTSDIIFASPLGLRRALGSANDKKEDYDFLSSVEILIIDQADAMLMQNWEHVDYILDHLNLQPKEAHGCDFSRVQSWYLDSNAKYLRQNIIFSAYNFPQLNRLFVQTMLNIAGKVKYSKFQKGAIMGLGLQVRQTFSRFETVSPATDPDDRFTYFVTAILPLLTKQRKGSSSTQQGVLLYVPLYADFVRLRNHLATSPGTQDISFGSISEYTTANDVSRARSHFASGRHSLLLYTERAHHFRRYYLRGVQQVIMYGLPENPIFYKELVGGYLGRTLGTGGQIAGGSAVRSLFSKFDILKLERTVGTERYVSLLEEKGGDTFDFS